MTNPILDESVFGAVDAADYGTGAVTFMFSEDADIGGLKMDAAKSAEHFAELVGTGIYDMGKTIVGRVTAVEADLRTRKVHVEATITDAAAQAKLKHGVFTGAQARSNAVSKTATTYTAVPGSLNLVDRPFDQAGLLHKRRWTAPKRDVVAAFEKAIARALAGRPQPSRLAKSRSGDPLADFSAAMRDLELASARLALSEAEEAARAARVEAEVLERLSKMELRSGGVVVQRRPGGVPLAALEPVTTYAGLRWADEPVRKTHG